MNTKGRRSNKLKLVIDFGGSMTKAIGGVSMNERYVLAMEPDVLEIPQGVDHLGG